MIKPRARVGSKVTVEISGLSHRGEGVGRVGDMVVFVPGALPGETVECVIAQLKSNFARSRLVAVLSGIPGRVKPICAAYGQCGGCQYQHIDYSSQLQLKTEQVENVLRRQGKLVAFTLRPTLGMLNPWHYRNKVHLQVDMAGGGLTLGYFRSKTHQLVDLDICRLLPEEMVDLWQALQQLLRSLPVTPFAPGAGRGSLRAVLLRQALRTRQMMAVLVTSSRAFPWKELVSGLQSRFPLPVSLVQNVNPPQSKQPLGEQNLLRAGSGHIIERIGQLEYQVSATSFFQVNTLQAEVLYQQVLAYAGLTGRETVLDVYCGTGTIALFLASKAAKVIGIETVALAIEDAKQNAARNSISNAEFLNGEAEALLPRLASNGLTPQVAVLDPPRSGCSLGVLETILKLAPDRIIYVSCDPATLARDLRFLSDRGYQTEEVQPVDMFPQTAHVECVVLMSNAKNG